ncbi:MAG: flavin reductase, partial [Actinobacteria bacterium]|nr:flavin reductase [Actinomycetota bacterium]
MSGPDHSAFRHALAQFPTGVTVVTGQSSARNLPVGLTVSSFNSVSLSPPLVLWSLSNQSQHL